MIRESQEILEQQQKYVQKSIDLLTIISNLCSCAFQTSIGYFCLDLVMAITIHFVQKAYLDQSQATNGVGLAYTIIMMLIMPICIGFNQSLNLHAARALGMNKIQLSRTYLNLTMYIHIVYFFPLCYLIYLLKDVFKFLIMDNRQETIDYAWQYLVYLGVSCVFAFQFEAFKTYMIACKVYTPFIVIHIITTSLHWIYCYLFIQVMDLKLQGACYAIVITEFSNCFLIILYFIFSEDKKHLSGLRLSFQFSQQFDLLKSYIGTSIKIVIHVYANIFAYLLLTILALFLSTNELGAQIIFSNSSQLYLRFPLSLSLALLSHIGSELPQRNISLAQKYACVGMAIFLVHLILFISLLWIFQNQWAQFYAPENSEIQQILLDTLLYIRFIYLIFDGAQAGLSGILKGIQKVEFVTISTFITYYFIGIPLICYLTYSWGLGLSIKGIWIGFGLASLILVVLYIILCFTTDWNEQASKVIQKIQNQNDLMNNDPEREQINENVQDNSE